MNVAAIQQPITKPITPTVTKEGDSTGNFAALINQLLNDGSSDQTLASIGDISGLANLSQNNTALSNTELNALLGNNAALTDMLNQFLSGAVSADQMLTALFAAMPTADSSVLTGLKQLFAGKEKDMQNKLMQVLSSLMQNNSKKFTSNELSTVMEISAMMFNQNYPLDEVISTVSGLNSEQIQNMSQMMGITTPAPVQTPTDQLIKPTDTDTETDTITQPTAKTLKEFMADVKQTGASIKSMLADIKAEVSVSESLSSSNPSRLDVLRNVFAFKTGSNLTGANLTLNQPDTTVSTEQAAQAAQAAAQQTVEPTATPFTIEQSFSNATQLQNKILEVMQQTGKVDNGIKELTMQLNPENLGKVTVKMIIESGRMNINVFTETAAAQKMLETRLGYLQDGMRNSEVPVDNVSVVHSPNETMAFTNGFYRESEQNAPANQNFNNNSNGSGLNSEQNQTEQLSSEQQTIAPDQGYYV